MLTVVCASAWAVLGWVGLALPAVAATESGGLTLVRGGQPTSAIILDRQPTKAAQFAAFELQWHVKAITGAELPVLRGAPRLPKGHVALLVGDGPRIRKLGQGQGSFGPQEYAVRLLGDEIALVGRDADDRAPVAYDMDDLTASANWPGFWDERGTLNAVYDFLERCCGVRWLSPVEGGTLIPHSATLTVKPTGIRRKPAFSFRDAIGATGDNPERYDSYTALWPEAADGYKAWEATAYPDLHRSYPEAWRYTQAKRAHSMLFLLRMRNGGEVARCNHSLYGYYNRFWEKAADGETARLFVERRPEMFAKGYEGTPPQMCYTSRALIQQLAQDARDYYDGRKTGADLGIFWRPALPNPFPVEPMDNASFCKCPDCQRWLAEASKAAPSVFSTGLHSDYFFNFVNEVQRELAKTHPDRGVVALAYMSHAEPPTRIRLDPRVAIQFCFTSNRSPAARASYEHEIGLLRRWAEEGVGRPLYLWLYDTFPVETANNGKYHCFPGFFAHAIGQQFRLFRRYGYRGVFHCGYGQDVEAYVTFNLMDDPTRSVDGLLDEYFRGLYGHAAKPMRRLYEAIETTYCDAGLYPKTQASGAEIAWGHLGTADRMAHFEALLGQARAAAQTDAEKRQVHLFELGVWDYMAEGRRQYVARREAPIPSVRAPRVPDAGGDPAQVDWSRAASLGHHWYDRGADKPSARALSGRIAHDGRYLYLELVDRCPTASLAAASTVFPADDWEIFVAGQRDLPYRQYAFGPTGLTVGLSDGEVNFRTNVPIENPGLRVVSDTAVPDRWVSRLSLPLADIIKGGVAPGDRLYMNILRVASPAISGTGGLGLDSWVSYCSVHEVDRLAEVSLE